MSAGWVAGTVRARAMGRRRLGWTGARELAASPSLAVALQALAGSPYHREMPAGASLAQAQHAVAATALWNLRVLAGWLPAAGVRALRVLAGWFEIANVDQHLRALAGDTAEPPFRLGMLATAWPRLAATRSATELRAALSASPWGDPGGDTVRDIGLGMRLAWAERVRARVPAAGRWAVSGATLLVARERFAAGRPVPATAARLPGRLAATSLAEFTGVERPADLWRAEAEWWARLRREGAALLAGAGFAVDRVAGAAAELAGDAFLVRAALAVADRGGGPLEAFDGLA